jgi:hypothetical protein
VVRPPAPPQLEYSAYSSCPSTLAVAQPLSACRAACHATGISHLCAAVARRSCALQRVALLWVNSAVDCTPVRRAALHSGTPPSRRRAAVHRSLQCYSLHCFSGVLGGRATGMCWRTDGSVPQVPALGAYMMSNASAEELPQYSFDLWVMDKGARARACRAARSI